MGSSPVGYHLTRAMLEKSSGKDPSQAFVSPVPSLFTLNTKLDIEEEGCLLYGLAGVSVPKAHVTFMPEQTKEDETTTFETTTKKKRKRSKKPAHLQQEEPLLLATYHGRVSGPVPGCAQANFEEQNSISTYYY